MSNKELEEGTVAADNLRPGGAPGQSRAEMTATFVQLMQQLGKEDLSDLYNRTLEMIGQEASSVIPDGTAEANRKSVSMKEDIEEVFSDFELTEDFKEKAATIFEAIVSTRLTLEKAKLDEEFDEALEEMANVYQEKLDEQRSADLEEITESLDAYMGHVASTWLEENTLAVESGIRNEILENFVGGLHNLFLESNINVPEESLDVLGEMRAEMKSLKNSLSEAIDKNIKLEQTLTEATKLAMVSEAAEGLASTQVEKLKELSENIEYTDADSFSRKLEIIRESYFKTSTPKTTGILVEEIAGEDSTVEQGSTVPSNMAQYVKTISKISK